MPDAQQSKAEVDAMLSLTRALEICLREFFGDKHYVLSQVLPLIADQKQEVLRAARTFLVALVTVYVARGSYKLNPEELKGFPDKVDEECWKKINTNQVDRVCDEHFYKLVQVNTSHFSCQMEIVKNRFSDTLDLMRIFEISNFIAVSQPTTSKMINY